MQDKFQICSREKLCAVETHLWFYDIIDHFFATGRQLSQTMILEPAIVQFAAIQATNSIAVDLRATEKRLISSNKSDSFFTIKNKSFVAPVI